LNHFEDFTFLVSGSSAVVESVDVDVGTCRAGVDHKSVLQRGFLDEDGKLQWVVFNGSGSSWVFDLRRRFLRRFRHWGTFDIVVVVRVSSTICTVQSISNIFLVWKKTHLVVCHSTSRVTSLILEVQIDRRGQSRQPLQWRTFSPKALGASCPTWSVTTL